MVELEVNGAFKYGRYANIWLKSFRVIFNVKFFAMEDGRPASWLDQDNSLHRSIHYVTHIDQKAKCKAKHKGKKKKKKKGGGGGGGGAVPVKPG